MSDVRKILVGYGPHGRNSVNGQIEHNWTDANEPLNGDGFVCCSNPLCACDRSFAGITTRKKATRGVVVEIPLEVYEKTVKDIYVHALAKFQAMPTVAESAAISVAQYRQDVFRDICENGLKELLPGSIVRIQKSADGKQYDLSYTQSGG